MEPVRSIVLLDGLTVMGGGPATTVSLGSLAPVVGPRAATVGYVVFDGDRGQADVICINDVRISDGLNPTTTGPCDQPYPTDDAFNATIDSHGIAQPVDACQAHCTIALAARPLTTMPAPGPV